MAIITIENVPKELKQALVKKAKGGGYGTLSAFLRVKLTELAKDDSGEN